MSFPFLYSPTQEDDIIDCLRTSDSEANGSKPVMNTIKPLLLLLVVLGAASLVWQHSRHFWQLIIDSDSSNDPQLIPFSKHFAMPLSHV
jgi:hypothetical protein